MKNREKDRFENKREPKDRPITSENVENVTDQKDEQDQKETD